MRISHGVVLIVVAVSLIVGLSLSRATVEQERLLAEFTAEVRQQVRASASALSRLDSVHKDMRMLADLVDRSRRGTQGEAKTERRVWESAFRALAVVVVHYRVIALVGGDGSLVVQAIDPSEDPSIAAALIPRLQRLGVAASRLGAVRLGPPSRFGARSFLLYATPVPSGGAIVIASDAALLLRTVAWPQVSFGRLFVTDPAAVVWSGCETGGGCRLAPPDSWPAGSAAASPLGRIDARQAERLGLFPAAAIRLSEPVKGPTGSWVVTWIASTQPILERERQAMSRTALTAVAAAFVVALVGVILLRQQRRADRLAGQLRYAKAEARAHELEAQLVRADRLITAGVMATEIAHEVGTPLAVVRGRAELVLRGVAGGPGAEDLRVVIGQVDQISTTIRQLLDFSRRSPLEMRSVSLETIIDRTRELFQIKLEARHLQLRVDLAPDLPMLTADPDQLQQVLVNLLLNACDASEAGAAISIAARPVAPEKVLIEVADRGHGISAEHVEAVFDPFFTTKARGEGTGLGLPIAAGIVRNHGGQIELRSIPEQGTTVTVLWPASVAQEGAHG